MMPLFIMVYDVIGNIKEQIGPIESHLACMTQALLKRNEMNIKGDNENTLYGVTIKDEKGIDRWNDIVIFRR